MYMVGMKELGVATPGAEGKREQERVGYGDTDREPKKGSLKASGGASPLHICINPSHTPIPQGPEAGEKDSLSDQHIR